MRKQCGCSIVEALKASLILLGVVQSTSISAQSNNVTSSVNSLSEFKAAELVRDGKAYEFGGGSQENWSLVSYMIDEEGQAIDIVVLDSSGDIRTDLLAKEEMEKSVYKPAALNGIPVSSAKVSRYVMEIGDRAMRDRVFVNAMNAFNRAVDGNDIAEAERILNNIRSRGTRGNYEHMQLSLAEFRYGVLTAEMSIIEQIEHLERVVVDPAVDEKKGFEDYLPDEVRAGAQQSLLTLYLRSNRFSEALGLFNKIEADLSADLRQLFKSAIERADMVRRSDQVYAVEGRLSVSGAWLFTLYKSGFAVREGMEKISQTRLRCDVGQYSVELMAEADYQMPEGKGQCSLLIQGEPGTKVTLLQF